VKKIVVATHVFTYGKSQAFRDYLQGKADVLFIGHPLQSSAFSWPLHVLDTIRRVLRSRSSYDLYFGSNNLNAFTGLILKAIGAVRAVIYYNDDSPPHRFRNRLLNRFYHWLDLYCVKKADWAWNNSSRMVGERERTGLPTAYRSKQIEVPMGVHLMEVAAEDEIVLRTAAFVGHMNGDQGLKMLIDALLLVSRRLSGVELLLIGAGPEEPELRARANRLGISENVKFLGFMPDIQEVYSRLSRCACGVAPYEPLSHAQYTDSGKIKNYLAAGLPVVTTSVPAVSSRIRECDCGAVCDPDPESLGHALASILGKPDVIGRLRKNVRELAKEFEK
jgi:glycosyltransferase involved in cell wall biosynthesis